MERKKTTAVNKRAKDRLTEQIGNLIDTKNLGQDQMIGRPPAQGWMRLVMTTTIANTFQERFSKQPSWPFCEAMNMGVKPFLSAASTSAPAATSLSKQPSWSFSKAMSMGVKP